MRTIWLSADLNIVKVIDQRLLPHQLVVAELKNVDDIINAIKETCVRGAPLIGAAGAYGVYLAVLNAGDKLKSDDYILEECKRIKSARPTAVNLAWAVDRVLSETLKVKTLSEKIKAALNEAGRIVEAEIENCRAIGENGLKLIEDISRKKQSKTVNILTHCNAGWLACIKYGTATAPIYAAFEKGIDVHVWVDETRPLNQGSRLTAWELGEKGVRHTIIADNAGGHLMQHGMVDIVIVGSDRTTRTGDVANKIGTYLKALAARDNNIPFYVALPSSTFDWSMKDGIKEIHIETRSPDEIKYVQGLDHGEIRSVMVSPEQSPAANFAFDVTPARLVTGLITERGICRATEADIMRLFAEKR